LKLLKGKAFGPVMWASESEAVAAVGGRGHRKGPARRAVALVTHFRRTQASIDSVAGTKASER